MSWTNYDLGSKPYLESEVRSQYPFTNMWRNEPLSTQSWIDPRKAGFRPYLQYEAITAVQPFNNNNAFYQGCCDAIYPVNKDYLENKDSWVSDLFFNR